MAYYGDPNYYQTFGVACGTAIYHDSMRAWTPPPLGRYACKYCSSAVKDDEIHYGKCPNCGAPMEL